MNKEFRKINSLSSLKVLPWSLAYDQSNKVQCHQVKNISITFIKQEPNGVSVLMNAKN